MWIALVRLSLVRPLNKNNWPKSLYSAQRLRYWNKRKAIQWRLHRARWKLKTNDRTNPPIECLFKLVPFVCIYFHKLIGKLFHCGTLKWKKTRAEWNRKGKETWDSEWTTIIKNVPPTLKKGGWSSNKIAIESKYIVNGAKKNKRQSNSLAVAQWTIWKCSDKGSCSKIKRKINSQMCNWFQTMIAWKSAAWWYSKGRTWVNWEKKYETVSNALHRFFSHTLSNFNMSFCPPSVDNVENAETNVEGTQILFTCRLRFVLTVLQRNENSVNVRKLRRMRRKVDGKM